MGVGAAELKTWLPKVAGLPAYESGSAEGPLWKRVARKNKELARILGEQWTGIPAVGFLLSVVYLFSSAGGAKTCQFQARAGRVSVV